MNFKYVLCFLGGVGAGGIGGYFVAKKKLQKKADETLEELTGEFTDTVNKNNSYIEELEKQLKDWNRSTLDIAKDFVDDNAAYASESEDPEEPEVLEEPEAEGAPEEEPFSEMDIYAIGIADFMQDAKYDKQYLTYYRGNECFVDSGDNTISNPTAILGDMVDMCYIYQGDVMYVRNTRTGIDYQIDFDDDAFDGGV